MQKAQERKTTSERFYFNSKPIESYVPNSLIKVRAVVGHGTTSILIDGGASANISSETFAFKSGITSLSRIKCPPVTLPDGTPLKVIGSAVTDVRFDKRTTHKVKLLVVPNLIHECIIGRDGMDQLKIKEDPAQHLIWIAGHCISTVRSDSEAEMALNNISILDAFNSLPQMASVQLDPETFFDKRRIVYNNVSQIKFTKLSPIYLFRLSGDFLNALSINTMVVSFANMLHMNIYCYCRI